MLTGRPTKFGSGIELYGDYWDLKSLHMTIYALSGDEMTLGNITLMSIAFDTRKAIANLRETDIFAFRDDQVIYRGFKIFWPYFLVAVKIMRERVDRLRDVPQLQSDIYRLESIVKECLEGFDPIIGNEIHVWLKTIQFPQTKYLDLFVAHTTNALLHEKSGRLRFLKLQAVLATILPLHQLYNAFVRHVEAEATKQNCELVDLDIDLEYDEVTFEW